MFFFEIFLLHGNWLAVLQYGKLFGSHVLLNKRRLTGNQGVQDVKPDKGKNHYRNTPIHDPH